MTAYLHFRSSETPNLKRLQDPEAGFHNIVPLLGMLRGTHHWPGVIDFLTQFGPTVFELNQLDPVALFVLARRLDDFVDAQETIQETGDDIEFCYRLMIHETPDQRFVPDSNREPAP